MALPGWVWVLVFDTGFLQTLWVEEKDYENDFGGNSIIWSFRFGWM